MLRFSTEKLNQSFSQLAYCTPVLRRLNQTGIDIRDTAQNLMDEVVAINESINKCVDAEEEIDSELEQQLADYVSRIEDIEKGLGDEHGE